MNESEYLFEFIKLWKPTPSWRKRRDDGDFVLLSDEYLEIHYLNSTARDILDLMNGKNVEEICNAMHKIYAVDKEVLRKDIINTIRELQWNHLIRITN